MTLPESLTAAFENAKKRPSRRTLQKLWEELEFAGDTAVRCDNPDYKVDLLSLWLQGDQMTMHFWDNYSSSGNELTLVFSLLSDVGIIKTVLSNNENLSGLAFMCLSVVGNETLHKREEKYVSVCEVLSVWTGEPVDASRALTIKTCVDMMYGRAAYDIYRSDVSDDKALPGYLCKHRIPCLSYSLLKNRSALLPGVELPDDMGLDAQSR